MDLVLVGVLFCAGWLDGESKGEGEMSDIEQGQQSPTIGALIAALAKAQASIKPALKDSSNPHYKSKYADLSAVWTACREALSANSLAVIQTTAPSHDGVTVITTLGHSSGEWVRGTLFVPASKNDAQGFGSALTYARRYGLAAIVGVSPDDDDGEAAVGRGRGSVQKKTTEKELDANLEPKLLASNLIASIAKCTSFDMLRSVSLANTSAYRELPNELKELVIASAEKKKQELASLEPEAAE